MTQPSPRSLHPVHVDGRLTPHAMSDIVAATIGVHTESTCTFAGAVRLDAHQNYNIDTVAEYEELESDVRVTRSRGLRIAVKS